MNSILAEMPTLPPTCRQDLYNLADDLRDFGRPSVLSASLSAFLPWTSSASFEQPASISRSTKPRALPRSVDVQAGPNI